MKYIDFEAGCGPEGLTIRRGTAPVAAADEIVIRVAAFGVNRADTLQRMGKYPPPPGESDILGLEVAGEVLALGQHVSQWQVGDKVMALVPGGGYAEQVRVKASHAMAIPDSVDMVAAAGICEVFLTAFQSLFSLGHLHSGQHLLVHAGASGVGLAAIQLARRVGAHVAVTASNAEKLAACQQAGAGLLINYRQQDFVEVIKQDFAAPNLIIDFVGGDYLNRNLKCLAVDGRVIYLAMLAGRYADPLDMALLLGKRAQVQGSTLRNRSDAYKTQLITDFSQQFLAYFAAGEVRANIDSVLTAAEVGEAHRRLEHNQSQGKLICCW